MNSLTTHERIKRMFEHSEADRVAIVDVPWKTTLERWHREGMPRDVDFADYFDIDKIIYVELDNSPRYEIKVLEETNEYTISTTSWGVTLKTFKNAESTPEFLDFTIIDEATWQKAKERMKPTRDRIDWDFYKKNYPEWRKKGYWIDGLLWFGFDVTHSWAVGTERVLMAMMMEPEWCIDMFNHFLDVHIALLEMLWDEGYTFDSVRWYDDLGFKGKQFFSVDTYRQILKPVHKKAVDWAHNRGIKTYMHSCGDVNPFVPEFIDIGIDCLNPLEVKAGMDPIYLKKTYGDKLAFHGGINAMNLNKPDIVRQEIERVLPIMKQHGGYIFGADHSIPDYVSIDDFKEIVRLAKKWGAY